MKYSEGKSNTRSFVIISVVLLALAAVPLFSSARTPTVSTSVNIVNDSSRTITHVYLSSVNVDDWSGDQISSAVGPGQSAALSNVACSQGQVKVIAEDQEGCFSTTVITCGEASTWTVTDTTTKDCGN